MQALHLYTSPKMTMVVLVVDWRVRNIVSPIKGKAQIAKWQSDIKTGKVWEYWERQAENELPWIDFNDWRERNNHLTLLADSTRG